LNGFGIGVHFAEDEFQFFDELLLVAWNDGACGNGCGVRDKGIGSFGF
jgi:hypothetical protein